ncbi:CaiB/BaiF CoA transferase family protein [Amycolatopsis alkalitolerans]|uniref:CoA transferase n=1 Tax=Amycolatopsis alkalitolerans TaxID=2547244 RepID=A0A5C4MBH2_9PSEU|nr:CoA transferase [Amycolatopsis alkalitolerans]TNC29442.1 CoA transferase [Amycolatopsis alkalitolerans]
MIGSLDGVRVVDVTTSVAGPFATLILGDLGADVVKVERPGSGDDTRRWGPPFWNGESPHFTAFNRNKRSVVMDLKEPADAERFRALVDAADVLVQNLRPGAMDALGFGYDTLSATNPGLIHCDMTGYGSGGPLSDRPAYDPLLQAFSGLMSMTGEPGGAPARIPVSVLDQGTGMWAAIGILDALRRRERTGRGTRFEVSLLNTALMWLPAQFGNYFADGTVPRRLGSGTIGIYPYGAFPTADGSAVVAAGNQVLWTRLCGVIGRRDLIEDTRFADNPGRVDHRDELHAELAATLSTRPTAYWTESLGAVGVPCTPIQTLDQVAEHEQVKAIGAFGSVPHPAIPDFRTVHLPVRDADGYPALSRPAPGLGEHDSEFADGWPSARDNA